ncbi:MAG TPA: flagellar hook-length control protein FliK [Steroidobacteraceae bacterium]|jgi:flagellar hook-length control protein FliK
MNATGLPIPANTSAPPPNAPSNAPPASANSQPSGSDAGSDDFLLMLAQFLGSGTAAPAATTQTTGGKALLDTDKDTDSTEADGAALSAMLPFTVVVAPPVPLDATAFSAALGNGDGVLDVKALALDGVAARAATDLLAASSTDKPVDDTKATNSNPNPAAAGLIDGSQATRGPTIADAAATTRPLHNPVGTTAWADELSARLTLLADRGQHSASLRLSPEHLGPLEVSISVRDNQASVWFGATHADTRAAIEQALPRLRELFASQGLSLADAGVFREPPREQPKMPQSFSSSGAMSDSSGDAQVISIRSIRLGLVDAYA